MTQHNIFQFDDFREFLKVAGPQSFHQNPAAFSLSLWAKKLGYKSHRSMAMVLQGQRLPSLDMVNRLGKYFSFTQGQKKYFELLVLKEKHKNNPKQLKDIEANIDSIQDRYDWITVPDTTWDLVYKWYFYPIKQLIGTKSFRNSISYIKERLRDKVDAADIRKALDILKQLKFVEEDPATGKLKESKVKMSSTNNVPYETLKRHHFELMQRAQEALYEQPVENRDMIGLTLRFDKSHLKQVKQDIWEFVAEFDQKYTANDANSVYQLNVQFFEHTK